MANAVAIQRTMLPPAAALLNCGDAFDLFAHTLPARDVGGDFYDYFLLDDHRIAITIGDVSGKGIPAALFMAATQTALRVALRQQQTLDTAIAAANNLLVTNNDEAMFATLFCATVDVRNGVGFTCNCGHPAPFVLRIIAWDVETIPDLTAAARMLGLGMATETEVREALGPGFPKHPLHKIVCIGALVVSRQPEGWRMAALGAPIRANAVKLT
jgi:sigma-B regulation protein RsbU (phosphoserine phosphatase)